MSPDCSSISLFGAARPASVPWQRDPVFVFVFTKSSVFDFLVHR
jgi:hypothetical protein